ncbi:hypothetical protein AB0K09_03520 [Streptomyces sp. NPDC049577]|uniref:hypothetical protein n=1 Tax=Streptomyces sp. NPDC049577 TaxID=3155153 RepID=UPI003428A862
MAAARRRLHQLLAISAPTFTQYRHRQQLLDRIRAYAQRAAADGRKVTTIIGSIRADEISADYPSPSAPLSSSPD